MPPLKAWTTIDVMRSRRYINLALLACHALPVTPPCDWSDSSSSSSSSSGGFSSGSDSSGDWDHFFSANNWNATVSQFGFATLIGAAEPYSREQVVYKVGPEKYSFDRLERDYGSGGDASCKAAFRFHLGDLRALFKAMHFPDEIDTGHEHVDSEEAFLIMLRRLAYPMTLATLAWPAGRSPYALSRCLPPRPPPHCCTIAVPEQPARPAQPPPRRLTDPCLAAPRQNLQRHNPAHL